MWLDGLDQAHQALQAAQAVQAAGIDQAMSPGLTNH